MLHQELNAFGFVKGRRAREEVAVAASALHLPFHSLLMKTMAECSSFCSPAGQQKLLPLLKQKKLRAVLLLSLSSQSHMQGREQLGRRIMAATSCTLLTSHTGDWHSMGGWLWPLPLCGTGGAGWGYISCLSPLWLPIFLSHFTGMGTSCSLFFPPQFPCVPLSHELTFHGPLRNTDPSC